MKHLSLFIAVLICDRDRGRRLGIRAALEQDPMRRRSASSLM